MVTAAGDNRGGGGNYANPKMNPDCSLVTADWKYKLNLEGFAISINI